MRAALLSLLLAAGCGGAVGMACGDTDACALFGLDVCTSSLGDRAPHAFCTTKCDIDDDCDTGNRCHSVPWIKSREQVCVPSDWLDLWHE